jgi:hypothetical protein
LFAKPNISTSAAQHLYIREFYTPGKIRLHLPPQKWDAYFSTQAKTPTEKQALLEREKEKYKVTVIAPDFFFGRSSQ